MFNIILKLLEMAGITLPLWVIKFVLLIALIIGASVFYQKYLKSKLKSLKQTIKNIESIEEIKTSQDELKEDSEAGDKALSDQIKKLEKSLNDTMAESDKKIDGIIDSVYKTAMMIDRIEVRLDEQERAKLKDRINELYDVYHKRGYWNSREKEAMEDLVESYLKAKGNSFVHDTIIPEMHEWDVREY